VARSARQILLAFQTLGLEKAEQIAKKIQVTVEKVQRTTQDTAREIKGRTKEAVKELRALKQAGLERERIAKSAAAFKARGSEAILGGVRTANEVRERAENVASLANGNLGALAGLLRATPGGLLAGAAVSLIAPITQKVWEQIEQRQARVMDNFRLEVMAEIERVRFELDYERRLKEDPRFAEQQSRKAFELATQEERAREGWHESADFLESFGG
jgi:UPF0716 family protein affecting phage T7 exclusion